MENYIMEDVKKIIRYHANRGIRRVIIDTSKVSENRGAKERWSSFGDDYRELYKLARPDGGGLNLSLWTNVQLADSALNRRYLDETSLAEFKGIKNEASVLFLMRPVWDDEYEGGSKALKITQYKQNKDKTGYITEEFQLQRDSLYYLLFTAKNRRGMSNDTGQDVLVFKPNFNYNTWEEVGYTKVFNEKK